MNNKQQVIHFMEEMVPFNRYLGMKVEVVEEGRVNIHLPWREEFVGDPQRRAVHGGVLSALIDTCGGSACWSALIDPTARVSTVDLRVDYLRKGPCENLTCRAEVVRLGNSVAVVRMEVFASNDLEQKIVATGQGVYNIAKKRNRPDELLFPRSQ
jgi:uncharacterized protein (TIGR00369 family)